MPRGHQRRLVFALGSLVLVAGVVMALGGNVWSFGPMDSHRFTAMAMATGTLRLHNGVQLLALDEQVYNGAVYTNWGYGVPLLQLPFEVLARHVRAFGSGFFPDRACFFVYAAGLAPLLWLSFERLLDGRSRPGASPAGRAACAFAGACAVLAYALFPLLAHHFLVWEETIAYFVVAELYALCAYCRVLRSEKLLPAGALGIAAALGLLVRPTGLVYLGAWLALVWLGPRGRARTVVFAACAAPLVAFWMYSNAVKAGSPFSLGYANSAPGAPVHFPMQRFGSECTDTLGHAAEVASTVFRSLFIAPPTEPTAHLRQCHFTQALQEGPRPEAPFLGLAPLVLLVTILARHLWRRERLLAVYVPFAAFFAVLAAFVPHAVGFVWRYAGDFWPLVVLAVVTYVDVAGPFVRRRVLGFVAAVPLAALSVVGWQRDVAPMLASVKTIAVGSAEERDIAPRFEASRWGVDDAHPSRLALDAHFRVIYGSLGWRSDGAVDTFTNAYLGVPPRADGRYELRIETDGGFQATQLRVYVNGGFYTAERDSGGTYRTTVPIDYAALTAHTVMVTIQWTRGFEAPSGRMLAMELG